MEDQKQLFLEAYDEHADALFRHCLFKINDREIAKDILQETFVKTWNYISLGNKVSNIRAFLYKTLNNLVIDEYRKKKPVSLDVLREDGFDPYIDETGSIGDTIDAERALTLLSKLPDPYKDAAFMRFVNNMELREISKITGEPENTIAVHIHRGLKKLRELFDNLDA